MEEEAPPTDSNRSICNPVYEAAPEPAESDTSDVTVSHSDLKNLHKLFFNLLVIFNIFRQIEQCVEPLSCASVL